MIDPKAVRTDPDAMREAIRVRKVDPAQSQCGSLVGPRRGAAKAATRYRRAQSREKATRATRPQRPGCSAGKRGGSCASAGGCWSMSWEPSSPSGRESWIGSPTGRIPTCPPVLARKTTIEENAWIPGQGYLAADKLGRGNTSAEYMPKRPLHAQDDAFEPLHHADLGVKLGGINTLQGGQVSGSRFAYLRGDVARMQYALSQLLIDELLARGYGDVRATAPSERALAVSAPRTFPKGATKSMPSRPIT